MIHHAWIALGGNQGDSLHILKSAREDIHHHAQCTVIQSSLLYQTPPLGPQHQPDYLNAVLAIQTNLHPKQLLACLQSIENKHGRIRKQHWGQRTLDLDILAFNQCCLNTASLTLPHAEMHKRQFVLKPLCDIDSNWHHPHMNQTASMLLQQLLDTGEAPLPKGIQW
jgi:2-amino-4-hydroxy-6-hydroxymethyldihydropteridine diphosphokinase